VRPLPLNLHGVPLRIRFWRDIKDVLSPHWAHHQERRHACMRSRPSAAPWHARCVNVDASSAESWTSRVEERPRWAMTVRMCPDRMQFLTIRKRDASAQVLNCKLKYLLNASRRCYTALSPG
jgi:hypothetical protein